MASVYFDAFLDRLKSNGDCIEFLGAKSVGYGHFTFAPYKVDLAHRVSYGLFVGRLKTGLVVDHACRNRACVNPGHLRQVTQQENILSGHGATAAHAAKTHCKWGHPFAGDNLMRLKNGRRCRKCQDRRNKARFKVLTP